MSEKIIGIFVGSLRKDSYSLKIAKNILSLCPEGYVFEIVPIGQLPLYNQDFDDHGPLPESYVSFRKKVKQLDGVIFVTPEYNRSVPAVLKNALDVASRPARQSAWGGKPGAVVSSSTGNISGFGANHHLRQSLTFLNIDTLQQPEVYLAKMSDESFDEANHFVNEKTQAFIRHFLEEYLSFFERLTNVRDS